MRRVPGLGVLAVFVLAGPARAQEQPEDLPDVDLPALVALCEGCHGAGGVSDRAAIPSLAGQPVDDILASLQAFYFYERHCPTVDPPHADGTASPNNMCNIASYLGDEEARALADHFAAQPRPAD